jgi:hypothetical protein
MSRIPSYKTSDNRRDIIMSPLSAQGVVCPGDVFIFANSDLSGPSKTFRPLDMRRDGDER